MSNQHRILVGHQVNPANDTLTVAVLDRPGSGGACHAYQVSGANMARHPFMRQAVREFAGSDLSDAQLDAAFAQASDGDTSSLILFQDGPIAEAGVNGVTHEVLLAILIDRLEGFQAGPYACDANSMALEHIKYAQQHLLERTRERMARGVEGTHKV